MRPSQQRGNAAGQKSAVPGKRSSAGGRNDPPPSDAPRRGSSTASTGTKESQTARKGSSQASLGGNKANQPEEEDKLQRKLSFIDCSIAQIRDGIVKEDPEWKFNSDFWHTILTGSPATDFKALQNRTLHFWVELYNKWMENGFPQYFDGQALIDLLAQPRNTVIKLIMLFDLEGYKRLRGGGVDGTTGEKNLSRVRVQARDLIMAGVMLSKLISSKMKLRFTFGLVDLDDSKSLDESQFREWIFSFLQGLGCAFAVGQDAKIMPSDVAQSCIAERLYKRISDMAGRRLKERCAGNKMLSAQIMEAIRKKNEIKDLGETAEEAEMPMSPQRSRRNQNGHTQVLKFDLLEDWCFRVFRDPLALPYALAIERFCIDRFSANAADEVHESLATWYLSHSEPVPLPEDSSTNAQDAGRMPVRGEIIVLRSVFNYCIEVGTFQVSLAEIEKGIGISIEQRLWARLKPSLINVSQARFDRVKPELLPFFQFIFPWAQVMHLKMFEGWCQQFDEMQEHRKLVDGIEEVTEQFWENGKKAVIPADELKLMEEDFDELDRQGRGYVTVDELAGVWDMDYQSLKSMLRSHNVSEDAYVDKQDYFRLVCPEHYRLPVMAGSERDLFGMLIECTTSRLNKDIKTKQQMFAANTQDSFKTDIVAMPMSLLPEVDPDTWEQWNAVFTRLDKGGDDNLDKSDLWSSGLLCQEVCDFLIAILGDAESGFTRHSFLNALLEVHNVRKTGLIAGEA